MNHSRFILLVLFFAAIVVIMTSGCAITGYRAEEVHRTMSIPLVFSDSIDAVGIKKITAEDGTVKRRADTLTHTTQVGGFTRVVVYKGAEIQTKEERK